MVKADDKGKHLRCRAFSTRCLPYTLCDLKHAVQSLFHFPDPTAQSFSAMPYNHCMFSAMNILSHIPFSPLAYAHAYLADTCQRLLMVYGYWPGIPPQDEPGMLKEQGQNTQPTQAPTTTPIHFTCQEMLSGQKPYGLYDSAIKSQPERSHTVESPCMPESSLRLLVVYSAWLKSFYPNPKQAFFCLIKEKQNFKSST